MSERFFIDSPIHPPKVMLSGDEFRHLAAVMRARPGDEVTLFDGSGAEFAARVATVSKREAELEIIGRREISRELPFRLTLAVALPKGDRQKWLVEKLTELGATCLAPLVTERGVAQPAAAAIERLRRGVIEASKQCGRNRLMEIAQPTAARDFFANAAATSTRLLAAPSGPLSLKAVIEEVAGGQEIVAAIGPEGGFSDEEEGAARQAGWQFVSLGPRILRIETAAVAIAAALSVHQDMRPSIG